MNNKKAEYVKRRNTLYVLMWILLDITLIDLILVFFGFDFIGFILLMFIVILYSIFNFKFLYLKKEFSSYYKENLRKQLKDIQKKG